MSKKNTRDPPVKKNAFVHKLYSMLSDPKLSHLIWWTTNEERNTFALFPGKEFAAALTGYFKHGNVASFVRQLHMYGFHKVLEPQSGSGASDSNNGSVNGVENPPVWEFKHSSGKFKKDDEDSLVYIKRRSSSNSSRNGGGANGGAGGPGSAGGYHENADGVMIPASTPSPNSYEAQVHAHYIATHGVAQATGPPSSGALHHPYGYGQAYVHNGHMYYQPQVLQQRIIHPQIQQPYPQPQAHPQQHPQQHPPQHPQQSHPPQHPQQSHGAPQGLIHQQHVQGHPQGQVPYGFQPYYSPSVDSIRHYNRVDSLPVEKANRVEPYGARSQSDLYAQGPGGVAARAQAQSAQSQAQSSAQAKAHEQASAAQTQAPSQAGFTPQFRKIWDNGNEMRPRNPSLLFDPLAPVPLHHHHNHHHPEAMSNFSSSAPPPSTTPITLPHPASTPNSMPLNHASAVPTSAKLSSPKSPSVSLPVSRNSIKLPPPSSLHRVSSNTSTSSLMSTTRSEGQETSSQSSVPPTSAAAVPTPSGGRTFPKFHSHSSSSSTPQPHHLTRNAASIPTSPSVHKKPSFIPINSSLQERLRPSLIELHLGQKRVGVELNAADSLGSQSSNNSIFSEKSSLSSISSFQRQSSFGSISHHSHHKEETLIGPRDPLPHMDQLPPLQNLNSGTLTPPPLTKNGAGSVTYSPRQSGTNGVQLTRLRSLTTSPFSKSNDKEHEATSLSKISESGSSAASSTPTVVHEASPIVNKVSVTSLLSGDNSNGGKENQERELGASTPSVSNINNLIHAEEHSSKRQKT